MKAKILFLLVFTSLASTVLLAQPPRLSKRVPAPEGSGSVSLMSVSDPLRTPAAAPVDSTKDAPVFAGDPNETSPQLVERYQRARGLIAKGAWVRAQLVLDRALALFPESRHLHALKAELLWYRSKGADRALIEEAGHEATQAMDIALGFGAVDYGLTDLLAQTLGRTGDAITLDRLFTEALTRDAGPTVYRHYALGLSRMNDPRAEDMFKRAVEKEPEGDALADYGEWLLDRDRDADSLDRIPKTSGLYYLQFLRGVALERSHRMEEARAAYAKFRDFSARFPAPARFRISGSSVQASSGIHFDDETDGASWASSPPRSRMRRPSTASPT
jgi:hypothetical protein